MNTETLTFIIKLNFKVLFNFRVILKQMLRTSNLFLQLIFVANPLVKDQLFKQIMYL